MRSQSAVSNIHPSPAFFAVLGLTGLAGYLTTVTSVPTQISVFVFVLAGWILSLIFHEFAHAFVAFQGGDFSVAEKGYLTLDPRRYIDPVTSLLLPSIFLLLGGIALPGGAVWVNRGAIRSQAMQSAMSLAGPATNIAFGATLVTLVQVLGWDTSHQTLAGAATLLAYFQMLAFALNILPVPGLDGFGAIEPFISHQTMVQIRPYRQYGFWVLLALLFFVPPARNAFFDFVDTLVTLVGADRASLDRGRQLFFFWLF